MGYKCKFCFFSCEKRPIILQHYRIKHGTHGRLSSLPCVHATCSLVFKTYQDLRQHLLHNHNANSSIRRHFDTRWPALFNETQLCAEFTRVCGIDLLGTFFRTLDGYTASLLTLLSGHGGIHGPAIAEELADMRSKGDTATAKRTFVLRCLLLFFGEARSDLYRDFCVEDEMKVSDEDVPPFIAVLQDKYEGQCAIVVEKTVIVSGIEDFPKAEALFMGFIYAVDMEYPGKPKSLMYEFLQKVILGLKGNEKHLSKRLNTLVNKLLRNWCFCLTGWR